MNPTLKMISKGHGRKHLRPRVRMYNLQETHFSVHNQQYNYNIMYIRI